MTGMRGPSLRLLLERRPTPAGGDGHAARLTPPDGTALVVIDLRACPTARAARSQLAERLTRVQCALFTRADLDRVAIVVMTGERPDLRRVRAHAGAVASAVHRRVELRRGRTCGIVVVLDDRGGADGDAHALVSRGLTEIPEGCDVVDAAEVARLGLRGAVLNSRI